MIDHIQNLNSNFLLAVGGVFFILIVASVTSIILSRSNPQKDFTELRRRIQTWWIIAGLFCLALVSNKILTLIFFAFVSFLALKEYLSLIPTRRADRRVLLWAYLVIPLQYYWIGISWYAMFIIFIPVYMFLFFPLRMVVQGETEGFLRSVGTLHWGLMITVFCLSHAAYLITVPEAVNPNGGGAGLLLYLIFLTEMNDVAQYIWGKTCGKNKVTPKVSPNKTCEGLIGGILTTTVLAVVLAPVLTPFDLTHAICAGLIIGLSGFIGDIVISALKRDLGVKDTGSMLAGHGGIMDRIDSLTYTAPLFFHFTAYLYF